MEKRTRTPEKPKTLKVALLALAKQCRKIAAELAVAIGDAPARGGRR